MGAARIGPFPELDMSVPQDAAPAAGPEEERLPVEPFQGTPEEIERQWLDRVYRGRGDTLRQLTWRAVLMGSVLGGVLSLTNLYIGLKAGWGFGVAITACILSYAIWTAMRKAGLARTPMSILENNCMQSTASSAGYSTGGTLVSAFAALVLLRGQTMPAGQMMAWVFFLAVLGVTMAIPMKRQMINVEQLRFPSGIAAAETLRALHATGQQGLRSARALAWAGLFGIASKFWSEGLVLISATLDKLMIGTWVQAFNRSVLGAGWVGRTVQFSWEPMFIAAGAITGLRVCLSMMIGSVTCWMIAAPMLQAAGHVPAAGGYRNIVGWTLWAGTACMVTSGILAFLLQWKSALRAFSGLGRLFSGGRKAGDDPMAALETPTSWFLAGQLVAFAGLAILGHASFGMPYWQTAIAVALSFALALVACRVTGETDTTPVGAMGKITQLTFGAISPGNMNVNLMSANVTASCAGASADLLTDLKSGYLLGANPRQQFLAQFAGIFVGTIVPVLCFNVLVPDAKALGGDQFPAPAAQTWKAVAEALGQGLSSLHAVKIHFIVWGALAGIVLTLLPKLFPKRAKWIPSPAGLGLAWTFHWHYGLLFLLGAVIGAWLEKKRPQAARDYTFPVASGVIAGESLMGVVLVAWENGPEMIRKLFG
jgi:uncharacterized oligopeptide transporter (OPT) family protein